jgi:hypothetical protein
MAERRMFSLKVINSAKFLKMPIDAQNLYFHLGLRADDDGIVEAYSVMRLIGSTEDNLKILHAKSFVNVLNEDLVTYITDWLEHNKIRSDRKINTIYKDLLVQILPDVKLIAPTERADRKKNDNMDVHGTSHGQPMDGIGKDRLGKDRLIKNIYMEVVKLTEDQYKKLTEKFGQAGANDKIENLALYLKSKGDKYKCHYSTILAWEKKNKNDKGQPYNKQVRNIKM